MIGFPFPLKVMKKALEGWLAARWGTGCISLWIKLRKKLKSYQAISKCGFLILTASVNIPNHSFVSPFMNLLGKLLSAEQLLRSGMARHNPTEEN